MSEPRELNMTVREYRDHTAHITGNAPVYSTHTENWGGDFPVTVQDDDDLPYNFYAWRAIEASLAIAFPNHTRRIVTAESFRAERDAKQNVDVFTTAPVNETVSPLAFIADTFAVSLPARVAATINIEGATQKESIRKELTNRLQFTAQPFGIRVTPTLVEAPVQSGYSSVFIAGLKRRPVFA